MGDQGVSGLSCSGVTAAPDRCAGGVELRSKGRAVRSCVFCSYINKTFCNWLKCFWSFFLVKLVTEGQWLASTWPNENICFQWLSAPQVLKQLHAFSSKRSVLFIVLDRLPLELAALCSLGWAIRAVQRLWQLRSWLGGCWWDQQWLSLWLLHILCLVWRHDWDFEGSHCCASCFQMVLKIHTAAC